MNTIWWMRRINFIKNSKLYLRMMICLLNKRILSLNKSCALHRTFSDDVVVGAALLDASSAPTVVAMLTISFNNST